MSRLKIVLPLLVVGLILSACPPKEVKQIQEAKDAIAAAKTAGAEQYAPTKLKAAEEALAAAETARKNRKYNEAVAQAELAKRLANEARAEAEAAQRKTPPPTEAAPTQPEERAERGDCSSSYASVLFDFDSSEIKSDGRGALDSAAKCLKNDASVKVTVTGYCDPRGTDEYNMALGERRAKAVQEYLVNSGVAADRISVVSKGESELLDNNCQAEDCWAKERRGVLK